MSIVPTFAFSLGQSVLAGPIAVGRFDGQNMSLACAAPGGRVIVHTARGIGGVMRSGQGSSSFDPHFGVPSSSSKQGGAEAGMVAEADDFTAPQIRLLNINRDIKCLTSSARLGVAGAEGRDVLVLGTSGSVQAYDLHTNTDVFHKETAEPVTAVTTGPWPYSTPPSNGVAVSGVSPFEPAHAVFAGGNCSVTAVWGDGSDCAWLVAGDQVTALAVADVDGDSRPEVIIGSADSDIRVLAGETAVSEITEGDRVTAVAHVPLPAAAPAGKAMHAGPSGKAKGGAFAFGLSNGTVGVYGCGAAVGSTPANSSTASSAAGGGGVSAPGALIPFTRLWRVKVKSKVTALCHFDFDQDGVPEVAMGWANGRVEIRKAGTGELLFRDVFSSCVAGLISADYRGDKSPVLIIVTTDGQVRAIPRVDGATLQAYRQANGLLGTGAGGSAAARGGVASSSPSGQTSNAPAGPAGTALPPRAQGDDSEDALAALLDEKRALEDLLREQEALLAASGGTTGTGTGGSGKWSTALGLGTVEGAALPSFASKSSEDLPAAADFKVELGYDFSRGSLLLLVSCLALDPSAVDAVCLRSVMVNGLEGAPQVFAGRKDALAAVPAFQQPVGLSAYIASTGSARCHTLRVPIPLPGLASLGSGALEGVTLHVTAVLAARPSAAHCLALTKSIRLPPFAFCQLLPTGTISYSPKDGWEARAAELATTLPFPTGGVTFAFPLAADRVTAWLARALPLHPLANGVTFQQTPHFPAGAAVPPETLAPSHASGGVDEFGNANTAPPALALDVRFAVLPHMSSGGGPAKPAMLRIALASANGGGGPMAIQCDNLALAGELVQSLAAACGIQDLETRAEFPAEFESFRLTLQRVADGHAVRSKLTGEMAEASSLVKMLVVEAEDCRLLDSTDPSARDGAVGGVAQGALQAMRASYGRLAGIQADLLMEYRKRAAAHEGLMAALRQVNQMISRAAALRVGPAKARCVEACRAALKANDAQAMLVAIASGSKQ